MTHFPFKEKMRQSAYRTIMLKEVLGL